MMKAKAIAILLLLSLQSGCVIYPTTRTYFEPNMDDGKPTRSTSCGYNMAAQDSLEREINDLLILISPSYEEGRQLYTTFLFRSPEDVIEVQPDRFELYSISDGKSYWPVDIQRKIYGPDKSHPYYSIWIHLRYPIASEKLNSIKFVFSEDVIKENGQNIKLAPFRFNKTKKFDIYYGSINC